MDIINNLNEVKSLNEGIRRVWLALVSANAANSLWLDKYVLHVPPKVVNLRDVSFSSLELRDVMLHCRLTQIAENNYGFTDLLVFPEVFLKMSTEEIYQAVQKDPKEIRIKSLLKRMKDLDGHIERHNRLKRDLLAELSELGWKES